MTKVSIIIPVFNAAEYLQECLDSVINQTFSNIEIICIDDKSTDGSLAILKSYASKDRRVSILQMPENSGVARIPRGLGIAKAEGDFICCIDADDRIDTVFVETLVNRQKETGADLVMGKMVLFNEEQTLFSIPAEDFDFSQVLTGREAVMLTVEGWKIGPSGALTKRELRQRQHAESAIDHHLMNSDEYDTRDQLANAEIVAFADTSYYYRQHQSSITKKPDRQFECLTTDRYLTRLFLEKYGKHSPEYRKMTDLYVCSVLGYARSYKKGIGGGYKWPAETAFRIRNIIRQNYKSLKWSEISLSSLAFKRKIRFILPFSLFLKLS